MNDGEKWSFKTRQVLLFKIVGISYTVKLQCGSNYKNVAKYFLKYLPEFRSEIYQLVLQIR